MNIGFFSGSFDPFTNGHLHVVKESAKLFDKVIIGIGTPPTKPPRFDKKSMKTAIEKVLERENLTNVSVIIYNCLTADKALEFGINCFIRGIRDYSDYLYEEKLATINEELSGINTIYIRSGNLSVISSTMVMELVKYNKDVSKYVPQEVLEVIKTHYI